MKVSVEKPGTPEELTHHGTKGMKWGVRRAETKAVRARSNARFNKKNPTGRDKANAIRMARAKTNVKYEQATKLGASKVDREKARKAFLNNPDRATALRFTRGEKITAGVLLASGVGTVPIIVVAGSARLARGHIEKKQARGGYK